MYYQLLTLYLLTLRRAKVLKGTSIVLSGLIPLGQDPMKYVILLKGFSNDYSTNCYSDPML
jgi:hypothetical protein